MNMAKCFVRHSLQSGFSLVELLIALALTAGIGLMAGLFINSAIDMTQYSESLVSDVATMDSAWQIIEMDLQHGIEIEAGADGLQLLRDGWANPLQQQRSALQQVVYRWEDGVLLREARAERNSMNMQESGLRRVLLQGVRGMQLRFLPTGATDPVNDWQDTWSSLAVHMNNVNEEGDFLQLPLGILPLALSITLETEELGTVQRLFLVPGL